MSTSMYWRPAPKDTPPSEDVSYEMKKILAPRLWGHDGSLYGEKVDVGAETAPYLEGLADAGVPGARALLDAITQHGRVELWIGE